MLRVAIVILLAANILYSGWEIHWGRANIEKHSIEQSVLELLATKERIRLIPDEQESNVTVTTKPNQISTLESDAQITNPDLPVNASEFNNAHSIEKTTEDESAVEEHIGKNEVEELTLCLAFGPIREKASITQLTQWFQTKKIKNVVQTIQPKNTYTLVYLENTSTIRTQLKTKNITELWTITEGALQGAISLGVFREKKLANKRVQELKGLGFDAKKTIYHQKQNKNSNEGQRVLAQIPQSNKILKKIRSEYPGQFEINLINCKEMGRG